MKHKYPCMMLAGILVMLACNPLTVPLRTPAPAPTAISSVELPYAKIEYYDVSGSSEQEIRDQLNLLAPADDHGYRGDALTSWEIHWSWDGYGTETCGLRSVTATYDIRVQLPRWSPPPNASPALITKWNAYTLALADHEKGHVDHVVAYLPYVIKTIRAATCTTAENKAQDVLSQLRDADLLYDEETQHGATQGATFP